MPTYREEYDPQTVSTTGVFVPSSKQGDTIEFVVSGHWGFPLDMLRHDCCYPADTDEAHNLNVALMKNTLTTAARSISTIKLIGTRCTPGRWASFGWTVTEITYVRHTA